MNAIKRFALATLAAALLGPVVSHAADIKVVNGSSITIKPYFKTRCWNPEFIAPTSEWVDFGGILAGTQFTWDRFEMLLDPKCKKPVVKFTYAQAGDPPLEHAFKRRLVTFKFDPAQLYAVTLGDSVVIKDVEPDEDED